eukprot:5361136-Pyramimonas_sp.AAC.1
MLSCSKQFRAGGGRVFAVFRSYLGRRLKLPIPFAPSHPHTRTPAYPHPPHRRPSTLRITPAPAPARHDACDARDGDRCEP